MSGRHHRHQRLKLRSLYVWHRYMGLCAAALVLVIAVTGLLLNHTETFRLDSRFIQSERLLNWYGIRAPQQMQYFTTGTHQVALLGEQLYLDRQQIPGNYRKLAGATVFEDMLLVAADGDLLLFLENGELIERLRTDNGLPAAVEGLATGMQGELLVRTDDGIYQSDSELLRWTRRDSSGETVHWIVAAAPADTELQTLQQEYRGRIVPLERLLLDLHSGRLFGSFGVLLFDLAAVILILLALSGTLIWLKRKR